MSFKEESKEMSLGAMNRVCFPASALSAIEDHISSVSSHDNTQDMFLQLIWALILLNRLANCE